MAAPDGSDGPHAFVDDLAAPALHADDRHHLERVLRLARGDPLTVSDGDGSWARCRFGPELEVIGPVERVPRPLPELTVAFALVKGQRPEWVTQKLTELGVDRIVPFVAARSVVRWDSSRVARNHDRLSTVAREAAMQSRRCWLPVVEAAADFAEIAGRAGSRLAERSGAPISADDTLLLVGPEGGWSPEERAACARTVALGDAVLRADTAAIVAGALMTALRNGLVDPHAR